MSIEIKLELGHKAAMRDKPSPDGFTHDWTVYVKGSENSNIFHFVDKVVFYLHESFPKPKRVVKEPPYQVSESGCAGFIMPIEVYFRSKEEPKKVHFEYDLFLRLESSPVQNVRVERLTFQNPSEDFRRKLLKARTVATPTSSTLVGGSSGGCALPTLAVAPLQHSEEPSRPTAHVKPVPAIPEKKPKAHSSAAKESSSKVVPPLPSTSKTSQPFNDLFGSPIKSKHSPEPVSRSSKQESGHSSHQKQAKPLPSHAASSSGAIPKEPKPTSKEVSEVQSPKAKSKPDKDKKPGPKRLPVAAVAPSKDLSSHPPSEKKRKHSGGGKQHPESKPNKGEEKPKHKGKPGAHGKKEKHKTPPRRKETSKSPKGGHSSRRFAHSAEALSNPSDDSDEAPPYRPPKDSACSSPSSERSGSPDDNGLAMSPSLPSRDMDNDFISPLSSDDESFQPAKRKPLEQHSSSSPEDLGAKLGARPKSTRSRLASKKHRKHGSASKKTLQSSQESSPEEKQQPPPPPPPPPNPLASPYHQDLLELQRRIMSLDDNEQLQGIVDLIEKTGKFNITSSTFDFDLCILDANTVRQLKNYFSSTSSSS